MQQQAEQERIALRRQFAIRSHRGPVFLSRFRASPKYMGRPAAADMAFCIAALATGMNALDIADALRRDYLSRDTNQARQAAYIRRTLSKAVRWAA